MDKSVYHEGKAPWDTITISGHGLSSQRSKISKSKAHNEAGPLALIEQESADALRYWGTSVKAGNDTALNLETIATGRRLVTKLWNASRFAAGRLQDLAREQIADEQLSAHLLPTDRWLLSRLTHTIEYVTAELTRGEYATARAEVERFFWSDLCDNYLELAKSRLYREQGPERTAAQWTLYQALLATLKMLAPYLPFVTEEIYQQLFRQWETIESLHLTAWPVLPAHWMDTEAEEAGQALLEALHQVRRYKAEQGLSVGAELAALTIKACNKLCPALQASLVDLKSATRAREIILEGYDQEFGESEDLSSGLTCSFPVLIVDPGL